MSEPFESSLRQPAFVNFVPAAPREAIERPWELAPVSLPVKRTIMAGAFLALYAAAYFGAGYATLTIIERAWSALLN